MLLLSHDQGSDGIAKAMGKEGDLIGEMYKVSFPRSDLTVMVKNVAIKPALALMGWAGFIQSGSTAVTYGDLVVLEDENLRREVQLAAASRARGDARVPRTQYPWPPSGRKCSRRLTALPAASFMRCGLR